MRIPSIYSKGSIIGINLSQIESYIYITIIRGDIVMKKYFLRMKLPIVVQVLCTILYSITVSLLPVLNKILFDRVDNLQISFILGLASLYIALIIMNILFQYFARLYEWNIARKFNMLIKNDLFAHIASMDHVKFKNRTASDYLAVFNNNVEVIEEDYISAYIDLVKSVLNIIVFASALLLFVDWRITLVVFSLSFITAFLPKITCAKLSEKRMNQLNALKSYFSTVLDLLNGKKRINIFTINAFTNEHKIKLNRSEELRYDFGKVKTISDLINALGVFFIMLSTFILVAILLHKNEISIGVGIAAFGYVTSFLNPITNILNCVTCINGAKETVKETLSFMENELLVPEEFTLTRKKIEKVRLENISYEVDRFKLYPMNYSFEIGKKYAIIGPSGSGKSTVMKLIDGSLSPKEGEIYVDDKEIDSLKLDELVFSIDQFEHLFNTDFVKNITIFNSMENDNGKISDLLNNIPKETRDKIVNYSSVNNLSGGEKQIVSILRMLVANRKIILMDEAYSSIDWKMSNIIKDYLLTLQDKIIIEVTHNQSEDNLNRYDHVITMSEGVIVR